MSVPALPGPRPIGCPPPAPPGALNAPLLRNDRVSPPLGNPRNAGPPLLPWFVRGRPGDESPPGTCRFRERNCISGGRLTLPGVGKRFCGISTRARPSSVRPLPCGKAELPSRFSCRRRSSARTTPPRERDASASLPGPLGVSVRPLRKRSPRSLAPPVTARFGNASIPPGDDERPLPVIGGASPRRNCRCKSSNLTPFIERPWSAPLESERLPP